ncbi:MAG: lysophospholipid acyltransferase family protein [Acidimicrobiia bacterium]|nr:lysophospholipid acyltransferase family protein [Acidimicrobiia bacterium]
MASSHRPDKVDAIAADPAADYRSFRARAARRVVTIPTVGAAAVFLTLFVPVWVPVAVVVDLARVRFRLPVTRLMLFGLLWAWIEVAGLTLAFGAWLSGRGRDQELHYRLMAWWTNTLMTALRTTTGLQIDVGGDDALSTGDALVLSRHASLGDSLVSAWVFLCQAGLRPRYVLKRELLSDPCLDVVGLRVPNYFLDREASDGDAELAEITDLARDLGERSVGVIFPEGTRSSPAKRERALTIIAEHDEDRAREMRHLQHLLPPRPAGTRALLAGAPEADLIFVWHTGFDGLDDFRGILDRLARRPHPAKVVARRVGRSEVPSDEEFDAWLDREWLRMDAVVDRELRRVR